MSKRVFDTYHASEAEIDGVKDALEAVDISYFETFKGRFGFGSAALWVSNEDDHNRAREAIDAFQQKWSAQIRAEPVTGGLNWRAMPGLIIVVLAVLVITVYWYIR